MGDGIKNVVRRLRIDPQQREQREQREQRQGRQLATDPLRGEEETISEKGVKMTCFWFFRGWHGMREEEDSTGRR
jgi:hypothetical protein